MNFNTLWVAAATVATVLACSVAAQRGRDLHLTVCEGDPSAHPNCQGENCHEYLLEDRTCYVDSESQSWLFSCMQFNKCFAYMLLDGGCNGQPIERGRQACTFCADHSAVQCNASSITQQVQCDDYCQSCTNLYTAELGKCTEIKEFGRKNGMHVDGMYFPCDLVLVQHSNQSDCSVLSSTIQPDGVCFSVPSSPFLSFQIDCHDHHQDRQLQKAPSHLVDKLAAAWKERQRTRF